ncbi:hypothetical protein Agub_g8809 [Astrephomene gubernaculifera]|uniref:Uncharacterized protein n=1 Tax=Astrephomene gubernaculifera TaxID=47775 RepID=A0AAD3HNE0_9CHLO|nr:hypothetical protein Agub_g8809 [Astrephomene gubernaculifera]
MLRWKQLKTYMSWQGWTVADLVGVLGELRTHQYPLAHGSKEQQESATPVMVEEWLNKYYGPDDSMHNLIKLTSKLTLPGKPLCKSPHSREIIENELKKTSIK